MPATRPLTTPPDVPPAVPGLAVLDDEIEVARFTRETTAPDGRRTAESSLRVGGMHCAACATTVEQALRRIDGVVDARVSAASQCATVQWDVARTRPSEFVRAITRAGYEAVPDTAAGARLMRRKESRDALWRLFVAVMCAMQVMMMATPSYVSGTGQLAPDLKQLLDWGSWLLTLPVLLFAAAPFFTGAWRSIRGGRIGMDVPAALGMVVAFVASSGAAFDPGGVFGHEVYFDSLTMFVSFLLGGRYLEMLARHRAATSLEDSIGRLPETALRENADGSAAPVSVLRLQRGDVVRVPVGQSFCADGVLVQGSTRADESLLSGESAPVGKAIGDTVVAGSVNLGAPVAMRVERVGADTRFEAIVAMMRDARSQRPAALRGSDRWAGPFLWAVLLLAAGAAAVWSVIDPSRAVWVAVSVLIVTCPCALSLAAPSALLSAAMAMGRRGVLLRRIDAIEGLARMQTLFIDKTGTLTEPQGQGVQMIRADNGERWSDAAVRSIAGSLAVWSSHPLARALAQQNEGDGAAWIDLGETAGLGLQARATDGSVWRLGRGPAMPVAANDSGDPETWLSRDGTPIARFRFVEVLRPDAEAAVRDLQRDGVHIALLSGDAPARVERVARLLALHDHRGGLTPQDKLDAVRAAQARGERVAMIGDGINDAPVLAQADTSLAMGEGAQIARAQADGVLVSNSLADVVRARALARQALRVVRQNLVWAAVYNAACVPLALIGWLPPWAAGLGMATSSLVVVLNSLRLAR
ncbi:MAG: cation-translocating P-type ATPase [Burkholderiales bacterium]